MLEAGLVVSRFFHFTAMLLLFGWLLFPLAVSHGRPPPRRALLALVVLALLSGAGWFVLTACRPAMRRVRGAARRTAWLA